MHPLVLLSTVDHYNRVAKDTKKRVVGVLLGSKYKGTVDVTNRLVCWGSLRLTSSHWLDGSKSLKMAQIRI